MIISPVSEWKVIKDEERDYQFVIKQFAIPIIVLCGVTKFLGLFLFEGSFNFFHSLLYAITHFIAIFAAFYLTSLVVLQVAPTFAPQTDRNTSFKFIAYSLIPYFTATLFSNLFSSLYFLKLFYLFSVYLLWQGLEILLQTPDSKKLGFIAIILLVIFMLILAVQETILFIIPI
jgi:hypothetical protein